jgi:hypothetical protein
MLAAVAICLDQARAPRSAGALAPGDRVGAARGAAAVAASPSCVVSGPLLR